MPPKPVSKLFLAEFACGKGEDGADGIFRLKVNSHTVERQEQTREHPGCSFVAIGKRMIAGDAKGECSRQRARIIFAIGPLVNRAGQRRFERTIIAQASNPAMLGQLPIMNRKGNFRLQPYRLNSCNLCHLS